MKKLIKFFLVGALICAGCATGGFSQQPLKYKMPDTGITVSGNQILHDGKVLAELRYFFTPQNSETQHRGLAIYYEKEKELVWIFPKEGLEEDIKRGHFTPRGDADGKVGWAYDVRISGDGKFIYWKKPGLFSKSSYVFSVEHGISELVDREWHM